MQKGLITYFCPQIAISKLKECIMNQIQPAKPADTEALEHMLVASGYSKTAIDYYINKPHMGQIANADITSEMTGTCGDTMGITIKMEDGLVGQARVSREALAFTYDNFGAFYDRYVAKSFG